MKIEVNIEKKYFIGIVASILILAGIFGIYAYTVSPGTIPNPGHSLDEIQGYFEGDASLYDTLEKFCQDDGSNCVFGGGYDAVYTPISRQTTDWYFGRYDNPIVLDLNGHVPVDAEEILVNVHGYVHGVDGGGGEQIWLKIYTREGTTEYSSRLNFWLYTNNFELDTNSDTFWLPYTSERSVKVERESVPLLVKDGVITVRVVGYR